MFACYRKSLKVQENPIHSHFIENNSNHVTVKDMLSIFDCLTDINRNKILVVSIINSFFCEYKYIFTMFSIEAFHLLNPHRFL